jgi:hypothetical protein
MTDNHHHNASKWQTNLDPAHHNKDRLTFLRDGRWQTKRDSSNRPTLAAQFPVDRRLAPNK